jgi:hypothetical protein
MIVVEFPTDETWTKTAESFLDCRIWTVEADPKAYLAQECTSDHATTPTVIKVWTPKNLTLVANTDYKLVITTLDSNNISQDGFLAPSNPGNWDRRFLFTIKLD